MVPRTSPGRGSDPCAQGFYGCTRSSGALPPELFRLRARVGTSALRSFPVARKVATFANGVLAAVHGSQMAALAHSGIEMSYPFGAFMLLALQLLPPRRGGAPSASQDGALLYPGPLCGGESGSTGRAAGVDRDVDSFSSGQESGRKARPRLTDLPGRDARQAPSGVAFSVGYLSLGHARDK